MRIAEPDCRKSPRAGVVSYRCRICGDEGIKHRYVAKEMVNGTREPFDYLLCQSCGTLFLANPPADIAPYYQTYYSTKHHGQPQANGDGSLRRRARTKIRQLLCQVAMKRAGGWSDRLLARYVWLHPSAGFEAVRRLKLEPGWRILDVGCGDGHLVETLDRMGYRDVTGCDPFIPEEKTFPHGARLVRADLPALAGTWDVVMLHHCYEHVPDPAATARHIAERLRPGGVCLLRFPNVDSVEFTRYGEDWWCLHAPRHYHLLSRKGMELVLKGTGLHIEQVWCDSLPDHYFYSHEYSLGLADNDPASVRTLQDKSPLWGETDRAFIERNVAWFNERLIGDWIVYVVRKEKVPSFRPRTS